MPNVTSNQFSEDGLSEELSADGTFIVVTVILTFYSIIGVIGNGVAFYIFYRRREKSTSVIFILALAGCDFFTCLVIIPYTITFEMLETRVVYDVICKLFMFLQTSNIPFSACIMVAIAFDRYFCICHPFLHVFNVNRAKATVACLVLLCAVFGVLTALPFGVYGELYQNVTQYVNTSSNLSDAISLQYIVDENLAKNSGILTQTGNVSYNEGDVNASYYYVKEQITVVYTGECTLNQLLVSTEFIKGYQMVHTALYIISFVSVAVLYTLIYKSIHLRRAKKAKRKQRSHYHSVAGAEGTVAETQTTSLNVNVAVNSEQKTENATNSAPTSKSSVKKQTSVKDTNVYANVKTAAMLFVVTLVFIISFLPSWLMAHDILPRQHIVFYMYFTYNVANPVIYAFMNQTFREDLKKIITICK